MGLENLELDIALTPKQVEFLAAIEIYREGLFGGARGGGKSEGLRSCHLIRRVKYAGSKGVIWRRTYNELERNHIRPLFARFPQLRQFYNEQRRLLTLPNGSTEEFCYAEAARDLTKAQGSECDDLGLEEAGDWLEDEYEILLATNRSTSYQPRAQCTANPGGRGHAWLKKRFVTASHPDRFYIQALVDDNPALAENDPGYLKTLENIKSETLRKAWRYGDWNITAGQFFDLRSDIHQVKPFPIPAHWPRFGGYDYGFNHPAWWVWGASDEDGNVYVYRELAKARLDIPEQAQLVTAHPDSKGIIWNAGLDCFAKKSGNDPTIAEKFSKCGVYLRPANINRILGATHCREYFAWKDVEKPPTAPSPDLTRPSEIKRIGPRCFIFNSCEATWDSLTRMVHDPDRVEDVLKVDATDGDPFTGDDGYDSFRYGLMSRPAIAQALKTPASSRYQRKRPEQIPWTVA